MQTIGLISLYAPGVIIILAVVAVLFFLLLGVPAPAMLDIECKGRLLIRFWRAPSGFRSGPCPLRTLYTIIRVQYNLDNLWPRAYRP